MTRALLLLCLAAGPAGAELTRAECETLVAGAKLSVAEARLLINDQIRAWVGLADDRDDTGHEARSEEAARLLDEEGMNAWDAYVAAIEADCARIGYVAPP